MSSTSPCHGLKGPVDWAEITFHVLPNFTRAAVYERLLGNLTNEHSLRLLAKMYVSRPDLVTGFSTWNQKLAMEVILCYGGDIRRVYWHVTGEDRVYRNIHDVF